METTSRSAELLNSHLAFICIGTWLFFVGLLGSFININNVVVFILLKRYHNAFGYLCIARGLCNIVNLLMFVLYTGPVTIFECLYTNAYLSFAEEKLEALAGVGYATVPVLQLGIACNRAIAALHPSFYRRIRGGRFASIFIFGGVFYGAAIQIDDIIRKCEFVYNRSQLSWDFVNCSSELQDYKFFYPTFSITGVTVIINAAVAIKIIVQKVGGRDVAVNAKLFWQVNFSHMRQALEEAENTAFEDILPVKEVEISKNE
ncbi:unnamed protein product [Cylicocyclus nassatus]|uniref:7TM GPCR serpentine receptor class x (Srx) domain-containing protein n=1 Tax=Cylicocyclus nassatus TaxID=53992 RepID=A0AA36GRW4_CYLNA|nr:unnamed protein product [Cylicocyclus nassatus]